MHMSFEMIHDIIELLLSFTATVFCFGAGISNFTKIFPTRYGHKHVELEGKVVGEGMITTRGGIRKCPVIEFYYKNKRYEIADTTYLLFYHNLKLGDVMTICYNPDVNKNVVIIKRGKYNCETLSWFYILVLGLFCVLITVFYALWLIKKYF